MTAVASIFEHRILDLINETRLAHGLSPLTMDLNLNVSADGHSQWMTDTLVFSHTGVEGSSATERMRAAGTDLNRGWGTAENIAAHSGYVSEDDRTEQQAARLHDGFMQSPPHRANILNPEFTHIGIGVSYGPMKYSSGILPSVIITQNFAYSGGVMNVDLLGGAGDDSLVAGAGDDVLRGLAANDRLLGFDGNDLIYGGDGQDLIHGDAGNDRLWGGDGDDTLFGGTGDDTLGGGKGNDSIRGGEGDDLLGGGGGRDVVHGDDGNDRIYSFGGIDTLYGGTGNDTINGGSWGDQLFGDDGDDLLYGLASNDILHGANGNDTLYGDIRVDFLSGGDGGDMLFGGQGWDMLDGGAENDTLTGGTEGDSFVFIKGSDPIGHDEIIDFNPAEQDRLHLDDALWGNADLSRQQIVDRFGWVNDAGDLMLVFDAENSIVLNGITDTARLADAIDII